MDSRHAASPPLEPGWSPSLGRALDLAQRVAADELRLLRLESRDEVERALRRAMWTTAGLLCLGIAWLCVLAAGVVALEGRLSLEARLVLLAASQAVLGAAMLGLGQRTRGERRCVRRLHASWSRRAWCANARSSQSCSKTWERVRAGSSICGGACAIGRPRGCSGRWPWACGWRGGDETRQRRKKGDER